MTSVARIRRFFVPLPALVPTRRWRWAAWGLSFALTMLALGSACERDESEIESAAGGDVRLRKAGQAPPTFVVDTKIGISAALRHHAKKVAAIENDVDGLLARGHFEGALVQLEGALASLPTAHDPSESQALRLLEVEITERIVEVLKSKPALLTERHMDRLFDALLSERALPLAETSAKALVGLGDLAREHHNRPLARASYMRAIRLLDQLRRYEIEHAP